MLKNIFLLSFFVLSRKKYLPLQRFQINNAPILSKFRDGTRGVEVMFRGEITVKDSPG